MNGFQLRLAVLAASLFFATPAGAQVSTELGLPLVLKQGGWARYVTRSSDGPTELVVRVGKAARSEKEQAHWLIMEIGTAQEGRLIIEWLIAGSAFVPENIRRMRVTVPGQEPADGTPDPDPGPVRQQALRIVGTRELKVAGKKLAVTEYLLGGFADGMRAGWSPGVPGLGLVYVSGEDPLLLVAFGQGGDPWKGVSATPQWPAEGLPPPLREQVTPAVRP